MIFYLLQELVEKVLMLFYLKLLELPIGIAVDTHCKRISNRIGLSNETDPSKIEQDLIKQIDKKYFKDVNHLFIWHGRYTCKSRYADCKNCTIKKYCKSYSEK